MCGIIGYIGKRNATPLLIEGLRNLEYRGYDSAGMFVSGAGLVKARGPVAELERKIDAAFQGMAGIAHTRWATHGEPSETNAHPHTDCTGAIYIVHNGIIENYRELKEKLMGNGHQFQSETDSEVIAHLVEEHRKQGKNLETASFAMLREIQGTYGVAIMSAADPSTIIVARKGSPIVIGIGACERFIASDIAPLAAYTKKVDYLEDGEVAIVHASSHKIMTLDRKFISRIPTQISWNVEQAKKGNYDHFMLKEIMESPNVIRSIIDRATLKELEPLREKLKMIKRIVIIGCGTAYHAGLVGKNTIETYAKIPTEVAIASEFRYSDPILDSSTVVIAISQSGETADTLAALREAKRKGAFTLSFVNVVGSTIARETDAVIYQNAGPEIGVASTKAFLSQVSLLILFALFLGKDRVLTTHLEENVVEAFASLPKKIEKILGSQNQIRAIANELAYFQNAAFIGRGYQMPIAYEGALKLKEISYIHAEGFCAGEMKHGSLAIIDKQFPTIALALHDPLYEKMISNLQEIKARHGKIFAIATEGDQVIAEIADHIIYIPETINILSQLLSIIPLQLLAYYVGVARGYNVDKPRNLAKSVTVE